MEPGAQALARIADALEVTTDALLGRSEEIPVQNNPKTPEARIVSGGMDKLPKEQREQILNVVRAMYAKNPELFSGNQQEDNLPDL